MIDFNLLFCFQAEKLAKVIKDSGNTVEPYWPMLFAKALKSANVDDLLTSVVSAGPAAGPAAAGGAAAAAAPVEEAKKEEEADVDVGAGGLFDDEEY